MFAAPSAAPPAIPVRRRRPGVITTTVLVTGLVACLVTGPALTAPASADGARTARTWAHRMLVWLNAERAVHGRGVAS